MYEEAILIAEAINSIRAEPSVFRDYLFPIVSGFFSAVLGACAAYFALKFQEKSQLERAKLVTSNDWTITLEGAFQSLLAIKENYCTKLSAHPFQRALATPTIIGQSNPIVKSVAELSFLVPTKTDPESSKVKWRQLSRIGGLVSNYNLVLSIWEKRNSFERPLREKLMNFCGESGYAEISYEDARKVLGDKDLVSLIDLTERAVQLTDDLIVEINDFLERFPEAAKSVIDTRRTKGLGAVIVFSNQDNPYIQKLLTKCPELDCKPLVGLCGISEAQLKELYRSVYHDS